MQHEIDSRSDEILEPDRSSMLKEFNEGKPVGESAHVEGLSDQFTWKRTFVNCWTGNPNVGKSTLLSFMSLLKSKVDDWKWCVWSPEMINSHRINGTVVESSSDILDEIIHAYTGKNPYKHFVKKYGISQMTQDEYMEALEWVQDRFIVINPKHKTYKSLIDCFLYFYETYGFDGWLIDPFKNIRIDSTGTMDKVLHEIFDEFKHVSIITNSSTNIVAHPKSVGTGKEARKNGKENGPFKVVTQYDLLGGSAWNNSMDGIFSVYRPFVHRNPNDPRTWLYHLKQRKKHLVGDTGVYKLIEYEMLKNRFYFDGVCPLDKNDYKQPLPVNDYEGIQQSKPINSHNAQADLIFTDTENTDDAPF